MKKINLKNLTITASSWKEFEKQVRKISELKWHCTASAETIAGINYDCVLKPNPDQWIIVEATKNNTLHKVRNDIINHKNAKSHLISRNIYCKSYIVMMSSPTVSMKTTGSTDYINVMDFHEFENEFINFSNYISKRKTETFGSSVDPYSGRNDETKYTPVNYIDAATGNNIKLETISTFIKNNNNIILLGNFGTGKSRCIKELFYVLSNSDIHRQYYPLAINLRKHWGSRYGNQIIRDHFSDYGLSDLSDSAISLLNHDCLSLLLDGFDEMATQNWSDDKNRIKQIRMESLSGVRDLISNFDGGIIISGREHYFNSDDEMFVCLGLNKSKTKIIKCRDEFSEEEMYDYLNKLSKVVNMPHWLPKRPLICQLISSLDIDILEKAFVDADGDIEFWKFLIDNICKREERIKHVIDSETIKKIYIKIAGLTRNKVNNYGPITTSEINHCFESIVGTSPVGESALILQRLPGFGRLSSEDNDRQFIDNYILDGLRSEDMISSIHSGDKRFYSEKWINKLDMFGVRRLSDDVMSKDHFKVYYAAMLELHNAQNDIALSDIISALAISCNNDIDTDRKIFSELEIVYLDLAKSTLANCTYKDCIIHTLKISDRVIDNIQFENCLINNLVGISNPKALPPWLAGNSIEKYEAVKTTSQIRNSSLSLAHKILIAIIKKTFFQPGSGRKEEALLRGFSHDKDSKIATKILHRLCREKILDKTKGDSGWIYIPKRHNTKRMDNILSKLSLCKDPLWTEVAKY